MLIALGILLWSLAVPCATQAAWWKEELWWQQEIPPPADPNQVINPEYLTKKQELDEAWKQLHRQNNMSRQYYRWTNRSQNRYWNDTRAINNAFTLEHELKKIPMYVEQGAPPAPEPEPAEEIILKY
jgi:hypothetical protein